jgi:hypothetical protein
MAALEDGAEPEPREAIPAIGVHVFPARFESPAECAHAGKSDVIGPVVVIQHIDSTLEAKVRNLQRVSKLADSAK